MSKIKITSNGIVFHPIKHFWSYMRRCKDRIGWETFIDGQTDGVLFYMNNGKKFRLMYDEIDAIERGYPCRKNWLS